MGDGYILYLDDVGGQIYTTVYLKRIYLPVSKLYLHNPDLKQANRAKKLIGKEHGETRESQPKVWYVPWQLQNTVFIGRKCGIVKLGLHVATLYRVMVIIKVRLHLPKSKFSHLFVLLYPNF